MAHANKKNQSAVPNFFKRLEDLKDDSAEQTEESATSPQAPDGHEQQESVTEEQIQSQGLEESVDNSQEDASVKNESSNESSSLTTHESNLSETDIRQAEEKADEDVTAGQAERDPQPYEEGGDTTRQSTEGTSEDSKPKTDLGIGEARYPEFLGNDIDYEIDMRSSHTKTVSGSATRVPQRNATRGVRGQRPPKNHNRIRDRIPKEVRSSLRLNLPEEKKENVLTHKQSILLDYLRKTGSQATTKKQLARETGLNERSLISFLRALNDREFIRYESEYIHYYKTWGVLIYVLD